MSAEIMEKANDLAEAIVNSGELAELRNAEAVMNNDSEAVKILTEFQEKQQQVYQAHMSGEELAPEDKKKVEEIEQRMGGNPAIRAYIEASEKFEHLMKSVNLVITRALQGEDEGCGCGSSSCGSDCGPDCGPCGCS